MTIKKIPMTQLQIKKRLSKAGIDDPLNEAMILISEYAGISPAEILSEPDRDYDAPLLEEAVSRREEHEPLQYIIGKWEFYGHGFSVGKGCLIPRQETELIVSYIIKNAPEDSKMLDLCTGSGCIPISVLLDRPDMTCDCMDISEDALYVADKNMTLNGIDRARMRLIKNDVTSDFLDKSIKYGIISANPPYLTSSEYDSSQPELKWEPKIALTDGKNGLSLIFGIIDRYYDHLENGGHLLIEIGSLQGGSVKKHAEERGITCDILKDYADLDRICHITKACI